MDGKATRVMLRKQIQIIQQGGTFTMNLLEDGNFKAVLETDSGRPVGIRWWLIPVVFDLTARLRECGCSDAQIRQAYESLLSGHDTNLTLDLD